MTDIFSIVSSLFILSVYVTYLRQSRSGISTPNSATWFIWLTMSVINLFTYKKVVNDNFMLYLLVLVVTICLVFMVIYFVYKGKFTKPGKVELSAFILSFIITIIWYKTGDEILTNLLLQVIFIISFYPTVNGLWKNQSREGPIPWTLAVIAYILMTVAILFDWENNDWVAFVHPVVIGIGCNGCVAFLAYKQKQ